jgi:hypothetical protein
VHPEPLWWHHLIATLQATLTAATPDGRLPDPVQTGLLRTALRVDRAMAAVREQRDREQLAIVQHVLDLNRALSGCRTLAELTREVAASLSRLNVGRCFGHTAEALRRDVSHVLDTIARARELTDRASELKALVGERTGPVETGDRQSAGGSGGPAGGQQ